jgi:hypothetical protein
MGFWNDTPNITYWDLIKSVWSQTTPPIILERSNIPFIIPSMPGIILKTVDFKNANNYSKFIANNFSASREVIIDIPSEVISEGIIKEGWVGIEARDIDLTLIGLVFSKPIKYFYSSEFPIISQQSLREVGLVDYFCISPAWRKKGLGTTLLFKLHELTRSEGRIPHIFASEGSSVFSRIPQIIQDKYIWRERIQNTLPIKIKVQKNISFTYDFLSYIQKKIGGKNFFAVNLNTPTEISYYSSGGFHILVKPTYERKGTNPVGEIIAFWLDQNYTVVNRNRFDILLDSIKDFEVFIAPSEFPRSRLWEDGASFGFYPFHFHPGAFDAKRLLLLI